MKKYIIPFLLFFTKALLAQTPQLVSQNIAKFIDGTVNIPFMAKVANINGAVRVRITMNDENLPGKFEVVQSLNNECDNEALRVVKLINVKNIQSLLQGKKIATFEVPFHTDEKIYLKNGVLTEYFDNNKIPITSPDESKFVRRFPIDTLTGKIIGRIEYFELKKNREKPLGFGVFIVDSTNKYLPEFSENRADSLNLLSFGEQNILGFPEKGWSEFPNGNIPFKTIKTIGNKVYLQYFPNGRVKSVSETIYDGQKSQENITSWFANGQMANEKTITKTLSGEIEEIVSAYDTTGNQLFTEKNGDYSYSEFYENTTLINIGKIKNGSKEGKWIGKLEDGKILYDEEYQAGKLVKGIGYYYDKEIEYTEVNKHAEMIGGIKSLQMHLLQNLRYPIEAQMSRITGKVFVGFDVCTDGTLCNYKILKGVEKNLNNEAIRVIKLMNGKWQPALYRGKPVKNKFNLPISFMLQ